MEHQLKILITNLWVNIFSGSEVNIYELSRYFCEKKYSVDVFCFEKSHLLTEKIEALGVSVYDDYQMLENEYDIIWCQHNVVLSYLIQKKISAKKIIFSSLSPYESFEFAHHYANETSICLANSIETLNKLIDCGVNKAKVKLFPNSVDLKYFYSTKIITGLKKIICVSNHVPNEIYELSKIFKAENIEFDIFGIGGGNFELIDREILDQYDCVVSIGKTVQYAMAMKIPVYCYDHFGGPGWITSENVDLAFEKNFSGRGFDKKIAQEIYLELVNNFACLGLSNLEYFYNFVLEKCDLDKNIEEILIALKPHGIKNVGVMPDLFKRVFDLWRINEKGYAGLFVQVFYDNGQNFNGEQYLQQNIVIGKNSYSFNLSDLSGITRLRLDPINQPAKVKLLSAYAKLDNDENYPLELVWHNADLNADVYDFKHDDPQMVFNIPVDIQARLVSVEFVVDITPYNKWEILGLLSQSRNELHYANLNSVNIQQELSAIRNQLSTVQGELQNAQSELNNTHNQLATVNQQLQNTQGELQNTQGELQNTQSELQSAQSELHGVYYSKSWQITKPLRKLCKLFKI